MSPLLTPRVLLIFCSCYTKIMQPQDGSQEYQAPAQQASGAPYQPVPSDEQPADTQAPGFDIDDQTTAQTSEADDDEAVLRWQAPEYLMHSRNGVWYGIFGVATLVLMALAIFLIQSLTFAILIPVMAVALFFYTRRDPQAIDYTLSRKGIHVNDKMYAYDMFKAFAIDSRGGNHLAILYPRKRFQMSVTAYFPEEVGEPLVDMLAARLPMQTHSPDFIDRLLTKLKI